MRSKISHWIFAILILVTIPALAIDQKPILELEDGEIVADACLAHQEATERPSSIRRGVRYACRAYRMTREVKVLFPT